MPKIEYNLATIIIISFIVVIGVIIHWLWSNVLSDKLAEYSKKKFEKAIDNARKKDTLYEANCFQLHDQMQNIINRCKLKNYKSTYDVSKFGYVYSSYVKLDGNHDGELLYDDFKKIELKPTFEVPVDAVGKEEIENFMKKYNALLMQ